MSKFEEFLAKTQQQAPETIEVSGSFQCQTCDNESDEAEFFPAHKVLRWKCSEGHESYIEGFKL